jgi:hypothetical protein
MAVPCIAAPQHRQIDHKATAHRRPKAYEVAMSTTIIKRIFHLNGRCCQRHAGRTLRRGSFLTVAGTVDDTRTIQVALDTHLPFLHS